jgi:hypothetical protein
MTNDTKEWVTVKIEEPIRDDAQDDPRTYTDIMKSGLTFEVDPKTVERFERLREDTEGDDTPQMTPDLFMSALLDTWEAAEDGYYDGGVDTELLVTELKDELSMAAEPTVDEGEIIDRVCKRIDDLQSQLPAQIREELRE